MELSRTTPCGDCAFRKTAKPGWTGNSTPDEFINRVHSTDGEEPCHMAVDYNDPDWLSKLDDKPFCVGGLMFLRNNMKVPRDPERAALVAEAGRSDKVFSWPAEFLTHHLCRPVGHPEAYDMMREANNKLFEDWEDR